MGDGARGVKRGRQRHAASKRREALGALESNQALQRGRDANRAAGVGAERRPGSTAGHRDRAARRRPARDARRGVKRQRGDVRRRAKVRIDAHTRVGELAHVGVADDASSGSAKAYHQRAILHGRRVALQDARAGGSGDTLHVEQILDRHRQATQRRQRYARGPGLIDAVGRGARRGVESAHETMARAVGRRCGDRALEFMAGAAAAGQDVVACRAQVNGMVTW